jgi:tetratricopeptide (TPR) repeat protein
MSLAHALTGLGLYSKARIALKRLETLARDKNPYVVHARWGGYYNALGDLKRAERCFRKAADVEPSALVFLGGVVARQGRLAEARRYHRLATRAPEHDRLARDEAYYNLGLLFRAERRYREALASFERAIALDPKYSLALMMRADVESALKVKAPEERAKHWRQMLDAMGGGNYATCHELVRAYMKRYPERSGGWVVYADVLTGLARYDEAIEALRKAERLARSENRQEPPDAFFAGQWGLLYQTKKDFRRAALAFRRAVALQPDAKNLTALAAVLVVKGQFAEARRHLQRAMRLGLDDPSTTVYNLALIARSRGQYADALKNLDAAIRHRPDYPLAIVARRDVREAIKLKASNKLKASSRPAAR